jgi:hypothetical protein
MDEFVFRQMAWKKSVAVENEPSSGVNQPRLRLKANVASSVVVKNTVENRSGWNSGTTALTVMLDVGETALAPALSVMLR